MTDNADSVASSRCSPWLPRDARAFIRVLQVMHAHMPMYGINYHSEPNSVWAKWLSFYFGWQLTEPAVRVTYPPSLWCQHPGSPLPFSPRRCACACACARTSHPRRSAPREWVSERSLVPPGWKVDPPSCKFNKTKRLRYKSGTDYDALYAGTSKTFG